jgi:cytidine deaminase
MDADWKKGLELAMDAQKQAYAPYSHYLVGASVQLESGAWISGHNIENASYGATVCAERVAIWKAVSQGERKFQKLIVLTRTEPFAPPCGQCLQVMSEFLAADTPIALANEKNGIHQILLLRELLPFGFSGEDL